MGGIAVYLVTAWASLFALVRPHIGLIAFYGIATLVPTWNWRWSIPENAGLQQFLAAGTLAGFVLTGFPGQSIKGSSLKACACFVGFLAVAGVSSLQTIDPESTRFFMNLMWKQVLLMVLAVRLLDTPEKLKAIVWATILAQGYNALRLNEQYFEYGRSLAVVGGWAYYDNNGYSMITICPMMLSAAVMFMTRKTWIRLLTGSIFVLQLHQIMLLESRGTMLGAMVGMMVLLLKVPKTTVNVRVMIVGAICGIVLAGPPVVKEFASSFASENERDTSAESRFHLWQAGAGIIRDYPLLGAGPNAARRLVPVYYPGGLDTDIKALHNLFFLVACGSGLFAAALYFGMYWVTWASSRRMWKRRAGTTDSYLHAVWLAGLAGIPSYLVCTMFSASALAETPYILVATICASVLVHEKAVDAQRGSRLVGDGELQPQGLAAPGINVGQTT